MGEAKNAHIGTVMTKNQKDFFEIKNYYSEITNSNLDLIRRLKEEHSGIKRQENEDAKKMVDLVQRNNQLKEPLKKAHQDVEKLEAELLAYEEDKKRLAAVKEKIKQASAAYGMLGICRARHRALRPCCVLRGRLS